MNEYKPKKKKNRENYINTTQQVDDLYNSILIHS